MSYNWTDPELEAADGPEAIDAGRVLRPVAREFSWRNLLLEYDELRQAASGAAPQPRPTPPAPAPIPPTKAASRPADDGVAACVGETLLASAEAFVTVGLAVARGVGGLASNAIPWCVVALALYALIGRLAATAVGRLIQLGN